MNDEQEALTDWARGEANRLREVAASREMEAFSYPRQVRHFAAAALAFLEAQSPRSQFFRTAELAFDNPGDAREGLDAVAEVLDRWAAHVEEGLEQAAPFEVRARQAAANDLMEQVQRLLEEPKIHLAAPVVLAGAALEEFLRGMVEGDPSVVLKGRPGLQAYAESLKIAGRLNAQDVKDVASVAGQRNDAAHGKFENLSPDRARLMADQVNLFIRQHTASE